MWDNIWIKKLLLSSVVGILFTLFILWYINVYIFNSKAGVLFNPVEFFKTLTLQNAPPLSVVFTPLKREVKVGDSFNYVVSMGSTKADQKVSAFDITFKYDPKLVEYVGVSQVSDASTSSLNTASTGTGAGGTAPTVSACASGSCPGSAGGTAGTGIGTGTGAGGAVATPLPNTSAGGAGVVPTKPIMPTGGGIITIAPIDTQPADQQDATGDTTTLSTLGAPVTQYEKVLDKVDATAGTVRITYAGKLADAALLAKPSFTLEFKAKAIGTGEVSLSKADATGSPDEIFDVAKDATADYVISAGNGGGGDTGTGKVQLDLTVKFYGVIQTPATVTSVPVVVSISDGGLSEPVKRTINFTLTNHVEQQTNHQLWHGVGNFDVPAGEGYSILIKGPMHVQKKIGDKDPSDVDGSGKVLPGFYENVKPSLTLKEGLNSFEFTGVMLMAGDVPTQDGIVNSGDLLTCRTLMNKTDQASTSVCDINMDGEVNGIDYSSIIKGLDFRRDRY